MEEEEEEEEKKWGRTWCESMFRILEKEITGSYTSLMQNGNKTRVKFGEQ